MITDNSVINTVLGSVMWSETVAVLGQDWSETKKSVLVLVLYIVVLVLVLQV